MEEMNVRRRLVQSTLFPHRNGSIKEGENCNGNAEEEGKQNEEEIRSDGGKKRRQSNTKSNSKAKTPLAASFKKVVERGKATSSDQVDDGNDPDVAIPDFFAKASEKRKKKRLQNEPLVPEALEENNDICSSSCPTASGGSTPQKLKRQSNSTPRKGRKSTPNKKLKNSARELCRQIPFDLAVDEQQSLPIPDLRLEAKLTAEENSRIFAGRQIHPFFTTKKGAKTNHVLTDPESSPSFDRIVKGITFNPVHIFENVEAQNDDMSLNWGKWTFSERSAHDALECGYPPVYEGSIASLNFDDLLKVSCINRMSTNNSSDQWSTPQKEASVNLCDQPECSYPLSYLPSSDKGMICGGQPDSVMFTKDKECIPAKSADLMLEDCKLEKTDCFSGSSCGGNMVSLLQDELLQERIISNYYTSHSQPENCLWTDKYQPRSAKQICGNSELVKLLGEWLRLWHKKGSLNHRICTGPENSIMQDIDHDYQLSDYDSDAIDDEESLKNVLLVTGPVGIGKSAAIYACARDEGFQVIEINASDWRNGPLIKQKFGEAVESHWLQRTAEKVTDAEEKSVSKFWTTMKSEKHFSDNKVIELIHLSDKDDDGDACVLPRTAIPGNNTNASSQHNIKTLILFEDVDVIVDEDHGFLSTVQQLAETAKRPIILTSNSVDPVLPKNMDRSELTFSVPSFEELSVLVNMICAAEKTKIHHSVAERFIDYCQGDIRRTIMLLQFWCQGQYPGRASGLHSIYRPARFDVEAAHNVLPKFIPFGFPSQLSEVVDTEVDRSLVLMKEIHGRVEQMKIEGTNDIREENIHEWDGEPESVKAKKEAMLNLNCPLQDEVEYAQFCAISELSDSSGCQIAFVGRQRNMNAILSSDSEEESLGGMAALVSAKVPDVSEVLYKDMYPISQCFSTEMFDVPTELISHSEGLKLDNTYCLHIEKLDEGDTFQSYSTSFVPESSFVPETQIINETELYSTTVSYGDIFGGDFATQDSIANLEPAIDAELNNSSSIMQSYQEELRNNRDASTSNSYEEEVGDSHVKSEADIARGCTMLDECSQVHIVRGFTSLDKPQDDPAIDYVQETWNRLHDQSWDLKKYLTAEEKTAGQVLNITHGTSDLISEADLLLKDCHALLFDFLKPTMIHIEKMHSCSYHDNQLDMSSILAEHGISLYAKEIASLGLNRGCESSLNLASMMLTSSASSMALGKLVNWDQSSVERSETIPPISPNQFKRKSDSSACDVLQSIVPLKTYLAVKGGAFHEYLSTLSQISRLETTRLSECIDKRKQRRRRVARHYLSSGSLAMSPEEISLLGEYSSYQSSLPHR